MKIIRSNSLQIIGISVFFFSLFLIGCKSCQKTTDDKMIAGSEGDDRRSGITYSLPSPFEVASIIQESGANFSSDMLNDINNVNNYTTTYKKGLNVGVYGADLGYVLMYKQTQSAYDYLGKIRQLTNDLGIMGAFELSTIERIEKNLNNQDSLLKISTNSFSNADIYLKENNREIISALILAGGWIEALHIANQMAQITGDEVIINRIGEQKIGLEILLKLLSQYKDNEDVQNLVSELNELNTIYEGVDISYSYGPPTVDPAAKTIVVNTTSKVTINEEQLQGIGTKTRSIRNQIIN